MRVKGVSVSAQLNSKKKSKAELKEEVKDLAFSCDFLSFTSQIFPAVTNDFLFHLFLVPISFLFSFFFGNECKKEMSMRVREVLGRFVPWQSMVNPLMESSSGSRNFCH